LDVGDDTSGGKRGVAGLSGDKLAITPPKQLSVAGTFITYFSLLHATAWVSLLYQAVGV